MFSFSSNFLDFPASVFKQAETVDDRDVFAALVTFELFEMIFPAGCNIRFMVTSTPDEILLGFRKVIG